MQEKKFRYLVADTTAFINNVQLQEYAEFIFTVPDVVDEVKSKRQIRRLVVLPFDLLVREPHTDCLKLVTEFAKKTGDFTSLSAIDLKIIALTYELEKQYCGIEHLRKEPVVRRIIASKNKPEELIDKTPLAGFYIPRRSTREKTISENSDLNAENNIYKISEEVSSNEQENEECSEDNVLNESVDEQKDHHNSEHVEEHLVECFEKQTSLKDNITNDISSTSADKSEELNLQDPEEEEEESDDSSEWKTPKPINQKLDDSAVEDILLPYKNDDSDEEESSEFDEEDEEDDDSSWITPTNVQSVKKEFKGDVKEKNLVVACMSTDYAIQNVLRQINLNLAALDGRVINQIRTYILRCYACFKTTSVMSKIFCPSCGNKTLKKVAVSLDENGQQVIHINLRRPLTCKYKNQSLPRPKGGRHSHNPILVEDQPLPRQMPTRVAKTKTNALTEDYYTGYSPFVSRDVNSRSALHKTKGNIKQWARNNMYEENRRRVRSTRLLK